MRILHCIGTMGDGGAERQVVTLCAAQVRLGNDVHVALLRGGANEARLRSTGAALHFLKHSGNRDPRIVLRLARLMGTIRPDVVHNWLTQMDVIGGLAAELRRVPWVASERSSADCYPPSFSTRLRALLVRRARAIIANSAGGARYWREHAPRVPAFVIPNAVPLDDLRRAAPAELEVPRPRIVYAGRLAVEKNVTTIIDAMAQPDLHDAHLILCGDGPLRPSLEQRARELGVDARVHFAGFVDAMPSMLKAADVFVSASFFEGHPNAVLEALACEVPVVLSDIAAHRELLDDSGARFFDPRSPDTAAAALADAIRDRSGSVSRVAAARKSVEMLDPVHIAERYGRVYETVTTDLRSDAAVVAAGRP